MTPPPVGQGHLLPAVAPAAEENGAALAAVQQLLCTAVTAQRPIKQRLGRRTPRAQSRQPPCWRTCPGQGGLCLLAPRAGSPGPLGPPPAREPPPGSRRRRGPAAPRARPGLATPTPALAAGDPGPRALVPWRSAHWAAQATRGAHRGHRLRAGRALRRAGGRGSVGVCWAVGTASSRRVAASPGRPGRGRARSPR